MKNILKKLACTALSGVLLVSAVSFGSAAKSKITTRDIDKTNPMFRLYNPNSGEHFYTKDMAERDYLSKLGWNYEGTGWTAPKTSKTPVYRLYNPNAGEHHYTLDKSEKDMLIKAGWNYEGIGWYSDDNKATPVYRQYNPNAWANNHNYTKNKAENDNLISLGWKYENIGWYGVEEMPVENPAIPEEINPKEQAITDFTEDDVEKIATELGLKYNRELNTDNAGWAGVQGRGYFLSEIENLSDVRGFIKAFQELTKRQPITECRLIIITPENVEYTYLLNPEKHNGLLSIAGNNKERIEKEISDIKEGKTQDYIFCYN
ncbi:MAG: hypothetical protein ACTTIO_05010 [Candidatus Fimenecus sp.]